MTIGISPRASSRGANGSWQRIGARASATRCGCSRPSSIRAISTVPSTEPPDWAYVGDTRGYRRTREGYSTRAGAPKPKQVFVRPLIRYARARLSQPVLDPAYHHGAPKLMLSAEHMRSLPAFFADIPDPRRAQGRPHPLPAVSAISTAAVLCGARGYKAISQWAEDLGQKARARFRCGYRNGCYDPPRSGI